jgi:hypothetical protein
MRIKISNDRKKLRNYQSFLDIPSPVEHDKRLGVPRGILWGLCISLPLWALLRWMVSLV